MMIGAIEGLVGRSRSRRLLRECSRVGVAGVGGLLTAGRLNHGVQVLDANLLLFAIVNPRQPFLPVLGRAQIHDALEATILLDASLRCKDQLIGRKYAAGTGEHLRLFVTGSISAPLSDELGLHERLEVLSERRRVEAEPVERFGECGSEKSLVVVARRKKVERVNVVDHNFDVEQHVPLTGLGLEIHPASVGEVEKGEKHLSQDT